MSWAKVNNDEFKQQSFTLLQDAVYTYKSYKQEFARILLEFGFAFFLLNNQDFKSMTDHMIHVLP